MVAHRGALDCLVHLLCVYTGQTLECRVYHYGYGVVTYHTVVFRPPQLPDGQIAVHIVLTQHAFDHVAHALGLEQGVERVAGTEGVP